MAEQVDPAVAQLEMTFRAPARFDGLTYRDALDRDRLSSALEKVAHLLLDERWHSLTEIREIAPSADSRVRDLRKEQFGGFTVERCRQRELHPAGGTSLHYYRLVAPTRAQVDILFAASLLRYPAVAHKFPVQPEGAITSEEAAA